MFLRRKKQEDKALVESAPALGWKSADGLIEADFPPNVINDMRLMIGRIESRLPLPRRIAFLSALREEGVTYITRAAGTTIANDLNAEVCIVDFNWWWPSSEGQDGLGDVLNGKKQLNEVLVATEIDKLVILPAGQLGVAERPTMVRSHKLNQILAELDQRFDYLLLDVPALLVNSEALPLASKADACCLVVRQGATSSEKFKRALDEVRHLNILGVVMNQMRTHTPQFLLQLLPPE